MLYITISRSEYGCSMDNQWSVWRVFQDGNPFNPQKLDKTCRNAVRHEKNGTHVLSIRMYSRGHGTFWCQNVVGGVSTTWLQTGSLFCVASREPSNMSHVLCTLDLKTFFVHMQVLRLMTLRFMKPIETCTGTNKNTFFSHVELQTAHNMHRDMKKQ